MQEQTNTTNEAAANETEEDGYFLNILQYPDDGQILNPKVPYTGALSSPLYPGQMIVLDGEVKLNATRFSVDLLCGLSTRSDIALHVNPRFDERRVVRNSRVHERWGDEEATATQTVQIKRGEPFHLYIFVTDTHFMIAFNGRHFCTFAQRISLQRVCGLHVSGDVQLFQLEHRREVSEYPQPGTTIATASLAVPTVSCPTNLNIFSRHIVQPDTPFIGDLPQGLEVGRQVELQGRVKILPHSFVINLQKGKTNYPQPMVILHFNPRFKEGHIVVRNSLVSGSWGTEERTGTCPFRPGYSFHMTIRCEDDYFNIFVDNKLFATYKYRKDLSEVDTIIVQGDVKINDIYVR